MAGGGRGGDRARAGHVALFRSVIARFGRTTLVVGAVVVIALVKLVLVLLLRRRATS
jgi:hypothetical protein